MDKFKELLDKFQSEFPAFEQRYEAFVDEVDKLKSTQTLCQHDIKHYRMFMQMLKQEMKTIDTKDNILSEIELSVIKNTFDEKEHLLREMEDCLPKQNGYYLSIVLGSVNVSFPNKQDKFAYKNNYENFKIAVSAIIAVLALLLYSCIQVRLMDSIFHLFIVWYYCTLTIRERILIQNGSRIKGWWATYHFILTAEAAVMLIWPHSESYAAFRDQFMLYTFYTAIVQCIQYYYQIGCLYKLRALGERPSMDITVDGYMSWMSKRLSFLLIFLILAYAFQFFNAYALYCIYQQSYCNEWQPLVVGAIYAFVCVGNMLTTVHVIRQKFSKLTPVKRNIMCKKYSISQHADDMFQPADANEKKNK